MSTLQAIGWVGYTQHVHSDGGGNGYTLHIHTAGGEGNTPCTSILIIWVEISCIRHMLPPLRRERRVYSSERRGRRCGSAGRGGRSGKDRREGGKKLEVEDVASGTEEAKAA
jgi:hypothetical protein